MSHASASSIQSVRPTNTVVVAWSGHRHLAEGTIVRRAVEQVVDRLLERHAKAWSGGDGALPCPLVGVGSAAIGADTVVAEVLQERGIPTALILPLEPHQFEPDASVEQKRRIERVTSLARSVTIVPRQPTDEDAFLEAGVRALELADLLIVVWEGAPSKGRGGTADVVAAAVARGLPVVRIDPFSGSIEWSGTEPVQVAPQLVDGIGDIPCLRDRADVQRLFDMLDRQASALAAPTRAVVFWIIVLHLAASTVIVFAVLADHGGEWPLGLVGAGLIDVVLLFLALWLASRYRPGHRRWLESRAGAELCRSFLAIWPLRRDVVVPPPAPTRNSEPIRRELDVAWLLDPPSGVGLEAARIEYLSSPGGDAWRHGRLGDQLDYFGRERAGVHSAAHCIEMVARRITWLAIAFSVWAIIWTALTRYGDASTGDHSLAYVLIKGLSIVLPLATAAILSYGTARDLLRRNARYDEMIHRLQAVRLRISTAPTWPALGRAVTDCEWMLLAEVGEWHAFTKYAGELHS